ncbi:hypothetical protein J3Q64DRAFT_1706125 [Phycomyces blakesleeanus]|uniref:C2H2-type domain-containing protein n=2 Tax=Phycomyces blakesleeanus TaxID=4837 RepID=A0ABR3BD49_PHYBL
MSVNNIDLTIDDLNNLLFSDPIINIFKPINNNTTTNNNLIINKNKMSSSNMDETAFGLNFWNYDASAINLGESSKNLTPEQVNDHFMAMFDVIPTISVENSPMMDTPFLEGNTTDTPFTPATSFTPCLNGFQVSPFVHTHMIEDADVQVSSYLNYNTSANNNTPSVDYGVPWTVDSVATFNGDPSQLLLGKTNNNNNNNNNNSAATVTATATNNSANELEQATDFLFPPLPSQDSYIVNDDFTPYNNPMDNFDAFIYDNDMNYEFSLFGDAHCHEIMPNTTTNTNTTVIDDIAVSDNNDNKKKRKISMVDDIKVVNPTIRKKRTTKVSPSEDAKRFACGICQCKFSRRFNLGTHMKTHVKDRQKDFVCNTCHKAFDRKHDCDRHVATVHRGERSYGCDLCSSSFSRKDALFRHKVQKHDMDDVV